MTDLTKDLSAQVSTVSTLNRDIEEMEANLSAIKAERDRLINVEIPNTLDLLGVASLVLSDGTTASIETLTNCTIVNRDAFFEYLENTDQGALIKAEPSIHAQTLKAWARRVDVEAIPEGLVNISTFRRAKIGKK